jgi:hypothetical protein
VPQYCRDLVLGQHHGDTMRLFGTHHLVYPANVLAEHLLVQKQNGTQGLALRGGGNTAFYGEVRQELSHLLHPHVAGMPFVMKANEAFHPAQIRFFRAQAIVPGTYHCTGLVKEPGLLTSGGCAVVLVHRGLLRGKSGQHRREICCTCVHYTRTRVVYTSAIWRRFSLYLPRH